MIDRDGREVLDEGSAAVDVQDLGAETDGEDGLLVEEGVLEEEGVDGLAGGVGVGAFGDAVVAVVCGIDVGWAAGEEDGLASAHEFGEAGRSEGNFGGLATGLADGFSVGRPGALVVFVVGGGGDGDRDAGLHV